MKLSFRQGTAADVPAVMPVMAAAFDPAFNEAWSAAQCQGVLGMAGSWLVIAEQDGRPVGFALGRRVLDEAELLLLAVAPGFRRLGVGGALVDRIKAIAGAEGAGRMFLEMREGNPAEALYRAKRFTGIGRRPGYYRFASGETCDAITLEAVISS
jgi:[ribosomal protein S18]-alanine N-acetyltransferase